MLTLDNIRKPKMSEAITNDAQVLGFNMSCDLETASLLRTIAASCKNGQLLELGTGAGVSTSWILDGMDDQSTLLTVEMDATLQNIAKKHLGFDNRVQFCTRDGAELIKELANQTFHFIFADTWPGKFYLVDETLALLQPGGLYVIDDLLPVPSWPEEHTKKVQELVNYLDAREDLIITKLNWSSGLIIATKKI